MYKRTVKLFEAYMESPEFLIRSLFDVLEKKVTEWFEDGQLGTNKAQSVSIHKTIGTGVLCVLHIGFETEDSQYSIEMRVNLEDVQESVTTLTMVTKKYDDDHKVINQKSEEIDPNALTEDMLLNSIAAMDGEAQIEPAKNPEAQELSFDDSGAEMGDEPAAQGEDMGAQAQPDTQAQAQPATQGEEEDEEEPAEEDDNFGI